MTDDNKSLVAARAYTARGLGVFPLNGKVPVTPNGVKDATTDAAQIEQWFDHARNLGIAVPPGFVVVDVDPRNGGDETLRGWIAEHGDSWHEEAPCAFTGGGGFHFWFRYSGEPLRKDYNGVDFQRAGKYVVAPPSVTTKLYLWRKRLPADLADVPWLPDWLLEVAQKPAPAPSAPRIDNRVYGGSGDELDDAAHRFTTWETLLTKHGWVHVGGDKWRHPSSDNKFSATITHDCLFVYSPNTPFEVTEEGSTHGYTLFRAIAVLDCGGDMKALARDLRDFGHLASLPDAAADIEAMIARSMSQPSLPDSIDTVVESSPELKLGGYLDWPEAFAADDDEENRWLVEPLIALGRAHALYAPAKVGKSLLVLAASAALATGRAFLDMPEHDPVPVLYADYEMTRDDVVERLITFGYEPADLVHLHYALLPSGNGLDTAEGAYDLVHDAYKLGVGLVVVDTVARAVAGAEDASDTLRAFARFTGNPLKRLGIASMRLDHAGKDVTKGQRGTSAKNDDVDIVWRLTSLDAGSYDVEATHHRSAWVPHKIALGLTESQTTGLSTWDRRSTGSVVYPTGTGQIAERLDELGAPLTISARAAKLLLREHGVTFKNAIGEAAVKFRLDASAKYLYDSEKRAPQPGDASAGRDAEARLRGRFGDVEGDAE